MTVVLAAEAIALVVMAMLVTGLLRAYGEILQRLEEREFTSVEKDEPPSTSLVRGIPITGTSPSGEPIKVTFGGESRHTLLAFMSTTCSICETFWGDTPMVDADVLPAPTRVVIVTRDRREESLSRLAPIVPSGALLVMSSHAWDDYKVPLKPYFIFVAPTTGEVVGEGASRTWSGVLSLVSDAILESKSPSDPSWKADEVDRVLQAAGIGPDHPSLWGGDVEAGE